MVKSNEPDRQPTPAERQAERADELKGILVGLGQAIQQIAAASQQSSRLLGALVVWLVEQGKEAKRS